MKVYIDAAKQKVVKACIKENKAILLIGETGTGKTTLLREEAIADKAELIRVSLNGATSVEELVGKWLAKDGTTYWQDGALTTAMKKGHRIVFDEINAALPEVLFLLQPLLDDDRCIYLAEKDNEKVIPHKNFRFFATMNPSDEYAGTKEMNKALISRFTAVLFIEVPPADVEMQILKDKGATPKDAQDLVQLAEKLRKLKQDEQIYYFCSTRDLVHAVELIDGGLTLKEAVIYSVFGKMSEIEKNVPAVKGLISMSFVASKTIDELLKEAEAAKTKAGSSVAEVTKLTTDNKTLTSKLTFLEGEYKKLHAEKEALEKMDKKEDFKKLLSDVIGKM